MKLRAVCLLMAAARVGGAQSSWEVSPTFGFGSRVLEGVGQTVRLTSAADRSPVPSVVSYSSENSKTLLTWGLSVRSSSNLDGLGVLAFAETNYFLQSANFLNVGIGGAGLELRRHVGPSAIASIGGAVDLAYLWGQVGTVGTAAGDVYLEAPDGKQYTTGASIEMRGGGFGGEFTAALQFGLGSGSLRFEGGYRAFPRLGDWTFRVADANDASSGSDLPSEGFSTRPPRVDLSGAMARISLAIAVF
jgi:hypothetical protein